MTPQEQDLVERIFHIRVRNNLPWQKLVEIGLRHAPEETRMALREITDNDEAVSLLMRDLAR